LSTSPSPSRRIRSRRQLRWCRQRPVVPPLCGARTRRARAGTRGRYCLSLAERQSTSMPTPCLLLSNPSSLRAGADQTAAPRRLQKPTPPGVSLTSAGQQAPEGSPSDIRDRLPKIDSDSSELAQPAFPRRSQSPNLDERPAAAVRPIAFVLPRPRVARSRWRQCDHTDPAVCPPRRTCGTAQKEASGRGTLLHTRAGRTATVVDISPCEERSYEGRSRLGPTPPLARLGGIERGLFTVRAGVSMTARERTAASAAARGRLLAASRYGSARAS
jgi:hypothetical protein